MHFVSKVRNNGTGSKALKIVSNVDGLLYNVAEVYIEIPLPWNFSSILIEDMNNFSFPVAQEGNEQWLWHQIAKSML